MLIVALIQLSAPVSIWRGGDWGRSVGIVSAAGNIVAQIMFMSALPGLAIVLLALDLLAIHALVVYGAAERRLLGTSGVSR